MKFRSLTSLNAALHFGKKNLSKTSFLVITKKPLENYIGRSEYQHLSLWFSHACVIRVGHIFFL
jgi:hypothetical protein